MDALWEGRELNFCHLSTPDDIFSNLFYEIAFLLYELKNKKETAYLGWWLTYSAILVWSKGFQLEKKS